MQGSYNKNEIEKEEAYERLFNIKTKKTGNNEENLRMTDYIYGPTEYTFLDDYFRKNPFGESDHLMDFGCGKGRVLIMAAHLLCPRVTGCEINECLYEILLNNIAEYKKVSNSQTIFTTYNQDVREIEIPHSTNIFFFNNPFHLKIYIHTFQKIIESLKKNNRTIKIVQYLPYEYTLKYLDSLNCFKQIELCLDNTPGENYYAVYSNVES